MTPDFRALCAELTDELHGYASANPHHDSDELVARARAALAEPEPPTDYHALLADALRLVETCPVTTDTNWIVLRMALIVRLRTALRAKPKPPVPQGEVQP